MLNIARLGRLPWLPPVYHCLALWNCPCRPKSSVSGTIQEGSLLTSTRKHPLNTCRPGVLRRQPHMTARHSAAMAVLHPQPGVGNLRACASLVQVLRPQSHTLSCKQTFLTPFFTLCSPSISFSLLCRSHFERPVLRVTSPYTTTRLSAVSQQNQTRYNEQRPTSFKPRTRQPNTSKFEETASSSTESESWDGFHAPPSASWRSLGVSETVVSALEAAGLTHPSSVQVSPMIGHDWSRLVKIGQDWSRLVMAGHGWS